MRTRRLVGMSLPELLVTLVVVGTIFSVLIAFFSFQIRTSNSVQGTNETNVRLRAAGEVVVRDLQLTGGRAVVVNGRPTYVNEVLGECDPDGDDEYADCIRVDTSTGATEVTLVYASSLWPAGERCRRIRYFFDDSVGGPTSLYRSDKACDDASAPTWDFGTEFANRITRFELSFTCADEVIASGADFVAGPTSNPRECYDAGSYVRSGSISVGGTSDERVELTGSIDLATNMPNVRNPVDFSAVNEDEAN